MKRLHKGDKVIVIAGKDKGKVGMITHIDRNRDRVKVEGVGRAILHQKANPQIQNPGGRVEHYLSLHSSNVMHYHPQLKKRSRVSVEKNETTGKHIRVYSEDRSAVE